MIAAAGLAPALSSMNVRAQDVSVRDFRVFVVDPAHHQLSLHWKNRHGQPYRSLSAVKRALSERGKTVLAVMNAGIYDKQRRPLGLHVQEGQLLSPINRRRGKGNFYLEPNGVFSVGKAGAAITRTLDFNLTEDISLATQSGPLLFDQKGLHPAFVKNSKHRQYRNALGVRKDGKVVFVMSKKPVTFWQLAHFLRSDLSCLSGLYLDGFISQLWLRGEKGPLKSFPFVGILAVNALEKAQ